MLRRSVNDPTLREKLQTPYIEIMDHIRMNIFLGGLCIVFLILVVWGLKKTVQFLYGDKPKHRKPGSVVRVDHDLYKVEKELGSGCCGIVYKVIPYSKHGKSLASIVPFALKIIHNPGTYNCEANVLRNVSEHPNIIRIYSIGSVNVEEPAIVMEYVTDSLKSLGRLFYQNPHRIRTIMYQLLQAVKHLHEHEIVHRDIKPENILYRKDSDEALLTDFGHARYTVDGRLKHGSEYARGTHSYFAPEGLKKERHQDHSLDIWSLGCILGKLVSGHTVFKERDDIEHMVRDQIEFVENRKWSEWTEWKHLFPKSGKLAKDLMKIMLQIDPKNRPSAEECLTHEWFHTEQFP